MFPNNWIKQAEKLASEGLYSPSEEHDSCGVGMIADISGESSKRVVDSAVTALKALWHRGAVDVDGKTGDGAGILLQIPQQFFIKQIENLGHSLKSSNMAVGVVFLPRVDFSAQETCRTIVESEILKYGFQLYGWRQVPVNISVIGEKAKATRPEIEHIIVACPDDLTESEIERALYLIRRRIEKRVMKENINDFYICSFSCHNMVYKGLFLAEQLSSFYPDLLDEHFISNFAIYHQRYSTNTFPKWSLAQPLRMLAHNGEINTIKGNINWMKSLESRMISKSFGQNSNDIKPIIQPGASDSAALDAVFEAIVRGGGRNAPLTKAMLIPEAYSDDNNHSHNQYYHFNAYFGSIMNPWDGPAAIAASDGRWLVAGLDRNGLRPLRYTLTEDNLLIVGSETGMVSVDERIIKEKGKIAPGKMIAIDLERGKFYHSKEIIEKLTSEKSYKDFKIKSFPTLGVDFEATNTPQYSSSELLKRQIIFGYTNETVESLLISMAKEGKEPQVSMGDDSPLAVLSKQYRGLHHFFRQNFSQVTNPPIDYLREYQVMNLTTHVGNLSNVLGDENLQNEVMELKSPVLLNNEFIELNKNYQQRNHVIDCIFDPQAGPGALKDALNNIKLEAEAAVREGKTLLVLTDQNIGNNAVPMPMILAAGGIHTHLIKQNLRWKCGICVRSGECLDVHYFSVLIGVGATVINPYLAEETIIDLYNKEVFRSLDLTKALTNYKVAINQGLLKIMAKSGISVLSSYWGGCNFEALGLSRTLVDEFFPGMPTKISGIGLNGIQRKIVDLVRLADDYQKPHLPVRGLFNFRVGGEAHSYDGGSIKSLQDAVARNSYGMYQDYVKKLEDLPPINLRDLLDFHTADCNPTPLNDVESITSLRKYLLTPSMSLGALSPEAHGTLNIAMNRIGSKSASGEGGENSARYKPKPNGDNANSAIKQVASGRFGVDTEYLNHCEEIEIKMAQGAKPGEGGHLPGFKVTTEIAKLRHSTAGVSLISPPPHHDIYSIEDLAQLIYDLKQVNSRARICVKLVARSGIGTIAAGVAKAKADVILISGHNGGTGSSAHSSIAYAGIPWEMGLSEVHQVLTLNGLRHTVKLRVDGGVKSGKDIVIGALLGGEEFNIGTAALIALGCLLVGQCHTNVCPVGICTQDISLREKYSGTPEKVINLFSFIAEEVREIISQLGFKSLKNIVGRTDLLKQISRGDQWLDDLDLNPLLVRVKSDQFPTRYMMTEPHTVPDTLDAQMISDAKPLFEDKEKVQLAYSVVNTHRAVGTKLSSEITKQFGMHELSEGHVIINLRGSAGQSLGAFAVNGVKIILAGDANDYVGKGLSGGVIVAHPFPLSNLISEKNVIIGNTVLYGATAGKLYAAGIAGERFAVRNSGAVAVIEGCGSNGCEYMSGGIVVVLGKVGNNFGAGMTGGMAYIYDLEGVGLNQINHDTVICQRIGNNHWERQAQSLIEDHYKETNSEHAKRILCDWELNKQYFWQVCPKEMLPHLKYPLN